MADETFRQLNPGEKIETDYLKDWIEYTIEKSKVFTDTYKVTSKRDYKKGEIKKYDPNSFCSFRGLVTNEPSGKVDYRGFTVKIDVAGSTYEGKIHIKSNADTILGIGLESVADRVTMQVFAYIFNQAESNVPQNFIQPTAPSSDDDDEDDGACECGCGGSGCGKYCGGSCSHNNVAKANWQPTEIFNENWSIQDIENLCKRLGLNNVVKVINPINPDSKIDLEGLFSEAIEYAEWRCPNLSEDDYMTNYENDMNYQTFNYTCDVEMQAQPPQQPKYWEMSFTVDSATNGILGITFMNGSHTMPAPLAPPPVGNLNCVVEVIKNADTKQVIGTVNVTLTPDEFRDVKAAYKQSKMEEEPVFDRMFCDTLTNTVESQLKVKYGNYDFGDIVATDTNGTQFKIENPWL